MEKITDPNRQPQSRVHALLLTGVSIGFEFNRSPLSTQKKTNALLVENILDALWCSGNMVKVQGYYPLDGLFQFC